MDAPSLRLNATIEHENTMVITCFPSVGMVSSIVAHYLIDHLELEFVGFAFGDMGRPAQRPLVLAVGIADAPITELTVARLHLA